MKKKLTTLFLLLVMLFAFGVTAHAEGFTLSRTKLTLNVHDHGNFIEASGTDRPLVWSSYNPNIVGVRQNGQINAWKTGKTTIRVRSGSETKTCAVTVVSSSIKLNKTSATLYHGTAGTSTTLKLKASVKGASKDVSWTSSDSSVAAVDQKGVVTPEGAGTAVITAWANSKSASCTVTVKENNTWLTNVKNGVVYLSTKGSGSTYTLKASVIGPKKTVKWTTSDKTVATVSGGGKVTGKKTGTAYVTATANGVSHSYKIVVQEGGVHIKEEGIELYTDGTKMPTVKLTTNAGKNDVLHWSVDGAGVATVDQDGLVTALRPGVTDVTLECNGMADTCEIDVRTISTDIAEDAITLRTKGAEKTYTLSASVVGKKNTVTWKSSDTRVASVSKGKVTAKKEGTAVITATANGVSDTVTVNVLPYEPTITMNTRSCTLYTGKKGNTVTLKATVDGPSKKITWQSGDTSVATVNSKGRVTAVGEGEAMISASANGETTLCTVTVKDPSIGLGSSQVVMAPGEKRTLTADVTGPAQTMKWSVAQGKVASVKNGVITAKALGETDVKVTANGVTAVCHVVVADECGHVYDSGTVVREATCSRTGIMSYGCILCGDSYNDDIPMIPHDFEIPLQREPDCGTEGLIMYHCVICGEGKNEVIPATGDHKYEWQVVVEPTCTEDGYAAEICTVCGRENYDREREYLYGGHDYQWTTVKWPSCQEDGYEAQVCTRCEQENYWAGHRFLEREAHAPWLWQVVKEPTVTEEGLQEGVCCRCGAKVQEIIPRLEEEPVEEPVEEPATEEPAEDPVVEDPAEEPATEDPVEEPVTEDPVEEPVTEDPVEEDPVEDPGEDAVGYDSAIACSCGYAVFFNKFDEDAVDDANNKKAAHIAEHVARREPCEIGRMTYEAYLGKYGSGTTEDPRENPVVEKLPVEEPKAEDPSVEDPKVEEPPVENVENPESGKIEETAEPLGVCVCNCGALMKSYTYGLSAEEKAMWYAHLDEHLAKNESTGYTSVTWATLIKYGTSEKNYWLN
ncbi:MAG: Ig-like domain-containing protein [Blautia sp.]|nr:Ig-like domain-containing protein [Lachnoclostridium sp.]MCM1210234.1 Ig-like domain-containing protein [Blautia sp.]